MTRDQELLRRAAAEIRELRRQNAILGAVADTVKAFSMALSSYPPSQGISSDIAWELEKASAEKPETAVVEDDG